MIQPRPYKGFTCKVSKYKLSKRYNYEEGFQLDIFGPGLGEDEGHLGASCERESQITRHFRYAVDWHLQQEAELAEYRRPAEPEDLSDIR